MGASKSGVPKPAAGRCTASEAALSAFLPLLFYGAAAEAVWMLLEAVWRTSGIQALTGEAGAALISDKILPQLASGTAAAIISLWYWPKLRNEKMEQAGAGWPAGRQNAGKWRSSFWRLPASGACYCIGMSGLICLAGTALGQAGISEAALAETAAGGAEAAVSGTAAAAAGVLTFLCTGLVIPFAEEILFRGLMYRRLRKRFGIRACALLTAFIFGIYHGNVPQGLYAGMMGLFLALLAERFQTVTATASVHIAANLTALTLDAVSAGMWTESYRLAVWGLAIGGLAAWAFLLRGLFGETNAL